ncbi:MAG: DUF3035 domain-containing protein [Hyphomonadaceae bacterium]|nr:DUF3035 domain-containing protein [Hyphomonadaceae bacterium]
MKKTALIFSAGLAMTLVTGCASWSGSNTPDEFRVVKKAPLVVPPEYSLRPPQAGQSEPFEVDVERAGTASAFGTDIGQDASAAERALVSAAGANAVSPVIRQQVDWEEASTIRKSTSIADRVLFWQRDNDEPADSATGGAEVTIERGSGERLKLPGT